jgi:hypothetical protein
MAGHVDEADPLAARQRRVGEAEVDGQTAVSFLFEAVGVDAGEQFDSDDLPWST